MAKLVELRNQFAAKQKSLYEYMASAKNAAGDYDPSATIKITSVAFRDEIKTRNTELDALDAECKALADIENADVKRRQYEADHPHQHPEDAGRPGQKQKDRKSLGQQFVESKAYTGRPDNLEGAM